MIRWNNDYNKGAHPAVLKAINDTNDISYGGYGIDEWCEKGADAIKKTFFCEDADVHFLVGGTQVNFTLIGAALRSYECVISADSGHISRHETGAVERGGHEVVTLPAKEGKITATDIAKEAEFFRVSDIKEHITEPKLVYISQPTEFGTLYSSTELAEISAVCREYGMYLYIDGARLSYGMGAEACPFAAADLAKYADAFYVGGTKCGALMGEALVIVNDALKYHFRSYMKQNGALLAKGWLLGLQFHALMEDGLYEKIGREAVSHAMRIKCAFLEKGFELYMDSPTNQQFVIFTEAQMEELGKKHIFEYEADMGGGRHAVRFCTGWMTQAEDVDELIADIKNMQM